MGWRSRRYREGDIGGRGGREVEVGVLGCWGVAERRKHGGTDSMGGKPHAPQPSPITCSTMFPCTASMLLASYHSFFH